MQKVTRQRIGMALAGAVAGFCLYFLSEVLGRGLLGDRQALFLTAFTGIFFAAFLAANGPLRLRQAAACGLGVAVPAAGLLTWASLRFDQVSDFMQEPALVLPAVLVAAVPLPFLIAAAGPGWRDYPALFSHAWGIVVRYAAAWLFVAVVWGVIFLSDALLGLVGLRVIEDLIDLAPVPWVVTGLVLGLALAVVTEMSDLVSPDLILKLLRLLLPVVLVVMSVFILALPFQGLSHLFGDLSAAATLLAMALAGVTLVSTAVDQSDADATEAPLMRLMTQMLALLLPLPAALAGWAVWLRVDQYGLTPNRLAAAMAALLALGYGVAYAAAVLRRGRWMARIRLANTWLALGGVVLAALWLTPVLNAQRLSAASQLARYEAGRTALANLDLALLKSLGRAGDEALDRLAVISAAPDQSALAARLTDFKAGSGLSMRSDPEILRARLREAMPLRPDSAEAALVRDALFSTSPATQLWAWLQGCEARLAGGGAACVMLVADLLPDIPGGEAVVFYRDGLGYPQREGFVASEGGFFQRQVVLIDGVLPNIANFEAFLAVMQTYPASVDPAPINTLSIGGNSITIMP